MTRESYDYRSKHCICITQNIDCVRLSKESLKKNYPSSTCILNTCKAAFICSINIAICRPNKNTKTKVTLFQKPTFCPKIRLDDKVTILSHKGKKYGFFKVELFFNSQVLNAKLLTI